MRSTSAATGILIWILLLSLPGTARAGGIRDMPPIPPVGTPSNLFDYPIKPFGAPEVGVMTRTAAGYFTGDRQRDCVFLIDDVPTLLINPTLYDAQIQYPTTASHLATLPETAAGGLDELLTIEAQGMRAWTRDSQSGTFSSRGIGRDLAWRNASILRTAQLDGLYGTDIYGATVDGAVVVVLLSVGGGAFEHESYIYPSQPALDVVAIDWDNDGVDELVVLSADGVEAFELNGDWIDSNTEFSNGMLAAIRDADVAIKDRLAWIVNTGGEDWLYLLAPEGFVGEPLSLIGFEPISAVVADFNADGSDDLLINGQKTYNLLKLENQGGTFSMNLGEFESIPLGPTGLASDNEAWPATADFDGDGDIDILCPVQSDEKAFGYLNLEYDHEKYRPTLADPVMFNFDANGGGTGIPEGYLQIELVEPAVLESSVTHLELFGYEMPAVGAPTSSVPAPGFSFRFPIGGSYESGIITLPDPVPKAYFFFLRAIEENGSGEIVRSYPAGTFAFSTESATFPGAVLQHLTGLGATFKAFTFPDPELQNPGNHETRTLSTIVELLPIEGFEEGEEPEAET